MKRETLNTIVLTAAVCAILMQLQQNYTKAGPQPPAPRVVPVVGQSIVAPSKTIAAPVTLHPTDYTGVVQAAINLEPGEVFMLTALTAFAAPSEINDPSNPNSPNYDGLRCVRQGSPTGPLVANAKRSRQTSSGGSPPAIHLTFPTGIRFVRLPNGRADLFLEGRTYRVGIESSFFSPPNIPDVMLHGYITNDF